jgi:SAM-dependent methyltransferase
VLLALLDCGTFGAKDAMLTPDEATLAHAEKLAGGDQGALMEVLRAMPLDAFGKLLLGMPDSRWPGLSARLPSMAPEDIQLSWTGAAGEAVMGPAVGFMQLADSAAVRLTGRGLAGKSVLDFGCGYGRMLRLLPWFTDRIFGCDPWDASLRLCEQHRVWGRLARSDYLPDDLPFGEEQFDVVLAFSVFTHTSARALRTALAAIRRRIAPGGLLVATIRPTAYWRYIVKWGGTADPKTMEAAHQEKGFAFHPHTRAPVDGDITYGDTSMTTEYLGSHEGWKIAGQDRIGNDPLQLPIFMRPI